MTKATGCLVALLLLFPALLLGQQATLNLDPWDGTPGKFINAQFAADTTANKGIPANRVYVLQRGGIYAANASFRVNAGETMRLRAASGSGPKPVIYLYPTGTGSTPANPPGNFIDLRGNLEIKNLVLTGYFEPIDTNLNNLQGALINVPTAGAGARVIIDSCILTNTNGNHVRTDGAAKIVSITNSIFANMGYLGRSNLGAGKGIDLRDATCDSMIVENSTFVNWQDRVIRHYNFANPAAGTGPIHFLKFNHNTLVNGMSYHGLLSLGSMGKRALITNNLLIDPFSLGNDTDAVRQAEFVNHGEKDQFGGARMMWIFTSPNDTTIWTIRNNYYAVSDSGQRFFTEFAAAGVTGEGAPLSYHINRRIGIDSTTAFRKITPPLVLTRIPMVMNKMNRWYRSPTGGAKSKNTPSAAWNHSFDYDRKGWQYFHDTLNCAYPTTSVAYTGAQGGYPVGDLNWFPSRKAAWLANPPVSVAASEALPESYTLSQNYPNPFNPATKIAFALPVDAQVRLDVFDLLGRRVATLLDEKRIAGEYTIDFNGSGLGSGVYIYQLSSGTQVLSKKMILLK